MAERKKGAQPIGRLQMENAFIANYRGDVTAAARAAGYKFPKQNGRKLMQIPRIKAAALRSLEIYRDAAAREAGEKVGRQIAKEEIKAGYTLNEICEKLAKIEQDKKAPHMAKVKALMGMAELKGYKININRDVSGEFEGRTSEECEFFANHGYWPEAKPLDAGDPGAGLPEGEGAPQSRPN